MTARKGCIDCLTEGITTKRKPVVVRGKTVPGSRCSTHWRARKTVTKDTAWERRLIAVYNLTADEYWAVYKAQGGVCYLCRRATGTGRRRLCVDHCHKTGKIRGLVCSHDNAKVLGHARDDIEYFERCIAYLKNPPAVAVIGIRITPDMAG